MDGSPKEALTLGNDRGENHLSMKRTRFPLKQKNFLGISAKNQISSESVRDL